MSSFPGSLLALLNAVDGVTIVHASDVNTLYDEMRNGIENTLGLNPQVISDAVAPGSTPTDVATYLDMVATQLKAITGAGSWYATPATTLAAINSGKVAVPGGVTTGDVLYYNGTIFTRLGIGSTGQVLGIAAGVPAWVPAPVTGIPAPGSPIGGDLLYYNGSAWARLAIGTAGYLLTVSGGVPAWAVAPTSGIPLPASPTTGALLYYDGAAWNKLAIGTTGQVLQVSGGAPVWAANTGAVVFTDGQWTKWNSSIGSVDVYFGKPAVLTHAGLVTQYSTIQAAINAANFANTDVVVVPPGTYNENLTIGSRAVVVELVPCSVVLEGTITLTGFDAYVSMFAVKQSFAANSYCVIASNTSGTNYVYVRNLTNPSISTSGGAVHATGSGGALYLFNCLINVSGFSGTAYGCKVESGSTVTLSDCLITLSGAASPQYDLHNAGTLNLNNVTFTPSKVSGIVAATTTDRQVRSTAATPATTGTMTVPMVDSVKTITPTNNCTFNASGGVTGSTCDFVITTSGTSSYTLTWGTGFKTTGTLATGTSSGKVFTVSFVYDGVQWAEKSRSTAM